MTEEERYAKVEADRQRAIEESNAVYDELLKQNRALTKKQNEYADTWQTTQNDIADKNATYQTELQNQNKQKAEKEFQNEAIASKNAYYDFINPYGAQAEIQAQNGLDNSGYSETTKLGAWNTQQNRTAKARASLNDAKLQYDNTIKEIELNRDTTKAQYALESLKIKLDAALQEYSNTSQLQQNRLSNSQSLSSEYNNRYNTVWDQINTEKQFQENIRQFDENINYLKQKDEREYQLEIQKLEEQKREWEKEYELSLAKSYSSGGSSSGSSKSGYSSGVVPYGQLVDSYGDGNGNMIYVDSNGNTYKMKAGYNPYTGTRNSDVGKGTFSNGYQPNNVNGTGLSSSGKKVSYNGQTQTVWTTGKDYYLWDGTQNKYLKLNKSERKTLGL